MNAVLFDNRTVAVKIRVIMTKDNTNIFTPNLNVIEENPIDEELSYITIEFASQDQANSWLINQYEADEFDVEDCLYNL